MSIFDIEAYFYGYAIRTLALRKEKYMAHTTSAESIQKRIGSGWYSKLNRNMDFTNSAPITYTSVINKTLLLFGIALVFGFSGYSITPAPLLPVGILVSALLGLGVSLAISFYNPLSKPLIYLYAALEGYLLVGFSSIFETKYSGIILQTIAATTIVFILMLAAYRSRIIKFSNKLLTAILVGALAVLLLRIGTLALTGFGLISTNVFSGIDLVITIVAACFAALGLIADFNYIDEAVENKYPEELSYVLAYSLMASLVWLYIELLRLISRGRE